MTYSIAEASDRSGMSIDTLRYYERIGLLEPPARDSAGRRNYTDTDLSWLELLARLRTTGMPIRTMQEYAHLCRAAAGTAAPRRQILVEHRDAVRARIAELTACLKVLDYKIDNYAQLEAAEADDSTEVCR
ncbi:MAG: MerR family transcriptional regulator [Micromonosporaceae bacterium]